MPYYSWLITLTSIEKIRFAYRESWNKLLLHMVESKLDRVILQKDDIEEE